MEASYQNDVQDEAFRQHKNYFQHFLDNEDGYGNYSDKIRQMMQDGSSRLVVDVNDLRAYDSSFEDSGNSTDTIVNRLMKYPMEYIPPFEEAIKDLVFNYDSTFGSKESKQREFRIGFEGSFGTNEVTARGLLSTLLCQLVCVAGVVTKCSAVRPKVTKSVHYCPTTNKMLQREYRDATSLNGLPTSSVYPTKDEDGNLLETEYGYCVYKDYQIVTIQEAPETAPLGQIPRSVDVIVEHDLVDKCKPGDRVRVIGCYRALGGANAASTSGVFRTVVISNNLQVMGKEVQGIVMTPQDVSNVRQLAKRRDIFDVLSKSVAPSIFGHPIIKQALLLQLLGGCEKNLENSTHLRGDINVLMVGDPSTAKSQLLRFVRNIAPLAVNTTGRGSSGVGLTAAVTVDKDTNQKRLEAGAMVLADRGIVCIDEFDKMSEADRVAIHEVMEQQTVTIAKAGIHATLNARCSVLAAANPVWGQYNKNKKPQENIGLPDSLLSRFDLLFVVLDKLERGTDRRISDHVLRIHRYQKPGQEGVPLSLEANAFEAFLEKESNDSNEEAATPMWTKYNPLLHGEAAKNGKMELLSMEFLKKYIYYAKTRFNPTLTDDAIDKICSGYAELRGQQDALTLPVTPRSLETLIRLATAHAKSRLSSKVENQDAEKALELMNFALYHETMLDGKEVSKDGGAGKAGEEDSADEFFGEKEVGDVDSEAEENDEDMEGAGVNVPVSSRKRSRGDGIDDEKASLEDAVSEILNSMVEEDSSSTTSTIKIPVLLKRINQTRKGKKRIAKTLLVSVLENLERLNRLMLVADKDEIIMV